MLAHQISSSTLQSEDSMATPATRDTTTSRPAPPLSCHSASTSVSNSGSSTSKIPAPSPRLVALQSPRLAPPSPRPQPSSPVQQFLTSRELGGIYHQFARHGYTGAAA